MFQSIQVHIKHRKTAAYVLVGVIIMLCIYGLGKYNTTSNAPKTKKYSDTLCKSIYNNITLSPDYETIEPHVEENNEGDGYCMVTIGNGLSYYFVFASTTDKLKFDYESQDKQVLTIYSMDMKKIQVVETPNAAWGEVSLHDDVNFDGYKDILGRIWSPRASQYSYYVFNPENGKFEEDEVLSSIFSPTLDMEKKVITATADVPNYYTDKFGDQQYYTPEEQTTEYVFSTTTKKYAIKYLDVKDIDILGTWQYNLVPESSDCDFGSDTSACIPNDKLIITFSKNNRVNIVNAELHNKPLLTNCDWIIEYAVVRFTCNKSIDAGSNEGYIGIQSFSSTTLSLSGVTILEGVYRKIK